MLKRVELSEIEGKTVRAGLGSLGDYGNREVAIVFDDDTYVAIDFESGWEPGDGHLAEADIGMNTFPRGDMIRAGFYTQEDYDNLDKQKVAIEMKRAEEKQANELMQLAILKEKYPNA